MCGIVGYIGRRQAQPIVLDCIARLEYRGYDSCGIALADDKLEVLKDAVRVAELARTAPHLRSTIGIAHTRWATHGIPNKINAHPHSDCTGKIAVVHNGIINNFQALRQQLTNEGHTFASDTDTEVLPHLIEKYYQGDLLEAVEQALTRVEGSYAIAVLQANERRLIVARKESPLIIGVGDRENFVASDVPAILDYTNRVIYLEDGDIGVLTPDSIDVKREGVTTKRKENKILWSAEQAKKGGYEHFMLKEIHEQPRVIRDTIAGWVSSENRPTLDFQSLHNNGYHIMLLACGTSYHAAIVGKHIIEELAGVPIRAELADEFIYRSQTTARYFTIAITQSGETADTLKAMKRLKEMGGSVVAITNVVGSSAARIADHTIYTCGGPEISVAATKTFTAQLMELYRIGISASIRDIRRLDELTMELRQLPQREQQVLDNDEQIKLVAKYLAGYENVFFIGRGINYPVALEGALKLKEISYIHAEGYPAGELKHGPFALLGEKTPVIAVVGGDNTYDAILSNIKEVKARGAPVIALVNAKDEAAVKLVDFVIRLPDVDMLLSPVVNTVALQLLAYYTARERNCPIDYPRNLAKSVTVE
jgi:glucosamine--fructose-6-phosphate aminotransferase (isomerizing)